MRLSKPLIRNPYEGEPLDMLFPGLMHLKFNLDQILLVELDGRAVGGLIIWDAGHDIVKVSNFIVIEPYQRRGVGEALMRGLEQYCRDRGRRAIVGETSQVEMAYWAKKRGYGVSHPCFLLWWSLEPPKEDLNGRGRVDRVGYLSGSSSSAGG